MPVKEKKSFKLKLSEKEVMKLPFITKARRVYFYRKFGKNLRKGHLYIKYGEFFSTSLFSLLEELKKGDVTKVWYSHGIGSLIELTRDEDSFLTGEFSTNYPSLRDSFIQKLGINNDEKP